MNLNLVPIGVKQGNEKKAPKAPIGNEQLEKLDDYLRDKTITEKETEVNGMVLPQPTYRDNHFNNLDSKLGNYNSTTNQQFNLDSDITQAMAANTIQSKKDLWRIQQLNQNTMMLTNPFGLVEASKRQYRKGQKVHRLSQQNSWM